MNDSLDRLLAGLPSMAPGMTRDARIRARCHAALKRRRASLARAGHRGRLWKRVVAPVLVGAFCVVYVSVMLWEVMG
jgi:hypothetical protein